MKKVIINFVHPKLSEDTQWAKQFAGQDAALVKEYPYQDWPVRAHRPMNGKPTWAAAVKGITDGAQLAGEGGLLQLLSGHSGSACVAPHSDKWDPRCAFPNEGAITFDFDGLVKFTHTTVFYRTRFHATAKTTEETDNAMLNAGKSTNVPIVERDLETTAAGRQKIRGFYDQIGNILRGNKVKQFVLLSCNLGRSPGMVDQIAKDWGVKVGVYKFLTTVVPGQNLKDNKARFTLGRDKDSPGQGTNVETARFDAPSLLDSAIAYVA